MSSGSPAQSTQVNKVELPAWVNQASESNYQLAKNISDRPYVPYTGQTVADPSALTTQGYGMLANAVGGSQPLYGEAADLYRSSAGPLDIQKYLNPYTSEVETNAISRARDELTRQMSINADSAGKASAVGGSRFGVQQGVTQAEGVRGIGDLSAQLRSSGFNTAASLAQQEQARKSGAAQGLLSTASGLQGSNLADIQALLSAGGMDQAQQQKILDSLRAEFERAQSYPTEQLNLRLASLGMSPYGKTETGMKTATAEKPATDWATVALGGAKAFPGVVSGLSGLLALSDRNTKTDIKKLTDGDIPMYSYRYKDDPKSYPKIVGPMAQDIEKKYPSAVKKVGRYKTIDLNNLLEVLS